MESARREGLSVAAMHDDHYQKALNLVEDKMNIEDYLGHRVPLAVVIALIIQAGSVVWWAASRESDMRFLQERLAHAEIVATQTKEAQGQMLERLARIDERLNGVAVAVDRVAKATEGKVR